MVSGDREREAEGRRGRGYGREWKEGVKAGKRREGDRMGGRGVGREEKGPRPLLPFPLLHSLSSLTEGG